VKRHERAEKDGEDEGDKRHVSDEDQPLAALLCHVAMMGKASLKRWKSSRPTR